MIAGFVAVKEQQVVGTSAVDISSELIDRIDVVSFAWPLRMVRFVGTCNVFDDGSLAKSHLPFHMLKRHPFTMFIL